MQLAINQHTLRWFGQLLRAFGPQQVRLISPSNSTIATGPTDLLYAFSRMGESFLDVFIIPIAILRQIMSKISRKLYFLHQ